MKWPAERVRAARVQVGTVASEQCYLALKEPPGSLGRDPRPYGWVLGPLLGFARTEADANKNCITRLYIGTRKLFGGIQIGGSDGLTR
jgi:hypothetical protein